jgi:U1 small nuclear ribonucleoprotein
VTSKKPRGYGFVEFVREKDLKTAFKEADGMKVDGRRIVVDVERGRTVKGWKPRRLGGGLGKTRVGGPRENQKISGRDDALKISAPPSEDRRGGRYENSHRDDYRRRDTRRYRSRSRSPRRRDYDRYDRYR